MESDNSKIKLLRKIPGIDDEVCKALQAHGITSCNKLIKRRVSEIVKVLRKENLTRPEELVHIWQIGARELLGTEGEKSELLVPKEAVDSADKPKSPTGNDNKPPPPNEPRGDRPMETGNNQLLVRDMRAANETAYVCLDDRAHMLRRKKKDQKNQLEPDLEQELIAAEVILGKTDPKIVIDPLFKAVQNYQRSCNNNIPDHQDGKFDFEEKNVALQTLIGMYGIMQRENQTRPDPTVRFPNAIAVVCERRDELEDELKKRGFNTDICDRSKSRRQGRRFSRALALAQEEYNRNRLLFEGVFRILRAEDKDKAIEADNWARVTKTLATRSIDPEDPLLMLRAREALAGHISAEDGEFPSGIAIDLPDLEADAEVEIIEDNLHAMQAVYFAAMLENANVFLVRDAIMNNFRFGLLPFGRGPAGDLLYRIIKDVPNRLSEYDRRNLYARTLGFPSGDAHGLSNRDFQILWLRFVAAVSSFARQLTVDHLLRADIPMRVRQEQVKKAGRDLAANLSLHGYGVTYFAATELQQQIDEMIELLSDEDVKSAYGARDMRGVVEQVSALELGGARDTVRYWTMAGAGAIIIRWLATNAKALSDVGVGDILDVAEIQRPRVRPLGTKATVTPFDSDLVNACERWLAVTGTPDQQVESYAVPAESPVLTSQPVRLPGFAREMLEPLGVANNVS